MLANPIYEMPPSFSMRGSNIDLFVKNGRIIQVNKTNPEMQNYCYDSGLFNISDCRYSLIYDDLDDSSYDSYDSDCSDEFEYIRPNNFIERKKNFTKMFRSFSTKSNKHPFTNTLTTPFETQHSINQNKNKILDKWSGIKNKIKNIFSQ